MDHPPSSLPPEPTFDNMASEILLESLNSSVMKKKTKKKKKNKACATDPFDPHSSAASYSSSSCSATSFPHSTQRGIRVSTGRRNPRVFIGSGRQKSDNIEALALPLGMSIAAVLAQVEMFEFSKVIRSCAESERRKQHFQQNFPEAIHRSSEYSPSSLAFQNIASSLCLSNTINWVLHRKSPNISNTQSLKSLLNCKFHPAILQQAASSIPENLTSLLSVLALNSVTRLIITRSAQKRQSYLVLGRECSHDARLG
ncbi:hypothetical protein HAX54_047582 [Datura stramonium]|uniref:Uncharacterized protein n=1 Tax=Datura stramonium TaxID=4076 RepID=A0ABS8ST65_DATST|nr:hypothetical protein [Datura stramonium]